MLAIEGIDARLGSEISTSIFYVLPVGIAAWYADRAAGVVFSLASAGLWLAADLAAGVDYSHWSIAIWNTLVRLGMFLIIANLLATLRLREDTAEKLAQTDHLTGLANSRRFLARLTEEIARAQRVGRPFTLAYADLDNFKTVNDRRGHAAGDRALVVVADTLVTSLRRTDLAARLGGDEFAVLLPETDEAAARRALGNAASSVLTAMEAHGWPITLSIGAVTFTSTPTTADEAIGVADELMYRVKAEGKNRIEHSTWPQAAAPVRS